MGLGRLLEASRVREKVALKPNSKSTKYELEGSYDDLVHEFSWTYHNPLVFRSGSNSSSSSSQTK